jgi:Lon protease-like protein
MSALDDLARVCLSETAHELCDICGHSSDGNALCARCAPAALRVLARAYLERAAPDERWSGAEQEWHAETVIVGTCMVPTRPNLQPRTKSVAPGLLDTLRKASR